MPGLDPGIHVVTLRRVEPPMQWIAGSSPAMTTSREPMPRFTVQKGKRYRAKIELGLFQSVASNDMVADRFREVGFTDVEVTGSGPTRRATGLWPHDDASAEIPSEVSDITMVA